MKKNGLLLILLIVTSLTMVVISATNSKIPIVDVSPTAWYYDAVKTVYEEGIMEGKTSTTFDPTANMSRAEFVTVLCRLSDESYEGKGNSLSFSDTDKNAWYADYVAWGVENDMVKGLPSNKFAPNQAVSRQEMAVFIDRFITYMNIELADNSKVDSFNDKSEVADYAKAAVETMRKSGIITGDQNGNFNPTNNASRAEVATVITRVLPLLNDEDGSISSGTNVTGEFVLLEENELPLSYYIYLPENYNDENKYPMIIYSRDKGDTSINTVEILFSTNTSLAYESIVIVPNTIKDSDFMQIDELITHVKNSYSTDNDRIYMVALNNELSTFETWNMLIEHPRILSAVVFVHGVSATLGKDMTGQSVLLDDEAYHRLPAELKDIPISIVHCLDDNRPVGTYLPTEYGVELYSALQYSGFNNIKLLETNGYPYIYDDFINENDMSQLEWLFAQRRETK